MVICVAWSTRVQVEDAVGALLSNDSEANAIQYYLAPNTPSDVQA